MSGFLAQHKKSHSCGELRASDIDSITTLMGWVDVRRDHGGCVFVDLRDRDGITQIVFDPQVDEVAHTFRHAAGDFEDAADHKTPGECHVNEARNGGFQQTPRRRAPPVCATPQVDQWHDPETIPAQARRETNSRYVESAST